MNINQDNYSFNSLLYNGRKVDPEGCPSLVYLVSLTSSANHKIAETLTAKRILSWLYGMEEQAVNYEHLRAGEEFFDRYFEGGFYPKTPCMVVKEWSPIAAMLKRGMRPCSLNREPKFRAVASGIWEPQSDFEADEIGSAMTDEVLFWSIFKTVSNLALEQKMWISVIAEPGWDYDSAINSLPTWPEDDVARSGRIVWKRTVQG